jgi:hypothetical protein
MMNVPLWLLLSLLAILPAGCRAPGCTDEVPDWVPIYPGMTVESTAYYEDTECEHTIDALSKDPVERIEAFYLAYLRQRSWKIRDLTDREIADRLGGIDPRDARGTYSQKIFPNRSLYTVLVRGDGVTRIRLITRMP